MAILMEQFMSCGMVIEFLVTLTTHWSIVGEGANLCNKKFSKKSLEYRIDQYTIAKLIRKDIGSKSKLTVCKAYLRIIQVYKFTGCFKIHR